MRTTNKDVVKKIQAYIRGIVANPLYEYDIKKSLEDVSVSFNHWYDAYNRRCFPNQQAGFIAFLQCLPNEICVAFYYHEQRKLLQEWLNETHTEPEKYRDSDVAHLFYCLIYREFVKLCKLYSVPFMS